MILATKVPREVRGNGQGAYTYCCILHTVVSVCARVCARKHTCVGVGVDVCVYVSVWMCVCVDVCVCKYTWV